MKTRTNALSLLIASLLLALPSCAEATASSSVVWATRTGTKYHLEACPSLSKSRAAVSLQEARSRGLEPCSICDPPAVNVTFVNPGPSGPAAPSPAGPASPADPAGRYRVDRPALASSAKADLSLMAASRVYAVVDGDTVKVEFTSPAPDGLANRETVRLLGVDTPETVHPNKGVERFGKEASAFSKLSLLGKEVRLAFDWDLRDGYGRLLAYLYLPDGSCFNAELIREGYAWAYLKYPFAFKDEFSSLQARARETGKGLWAEAD
jgi:micrococcal nuclease